jgi:hypothetical protein
LFHTSVLYPRFSDWNLELFHTSVLYPRFFDRNLSWFYNLSIGIWNCSDSVVFFVFHATTH